VEVAGVTGEMRLRSLRGAPTAAMFLPIEATAEVPRHLVIRTARRDDVTGELRRALAALSGDLLVTRVEPYAPLIAASLADTQVTARLVLPVSAIALTLSMAGLYGVVSRRVVERQREFGVRLALGATPRTIVRAVLREVVLVVLLACAIGGVTFAIASAAMRQLLFGVAAFDPLTLGATFAVIVVLAVSAALRPACRAGKADPVAALRASG
jgi:predicted lysophospholipase L1 biosynthesis ABC-type transport system permease subunit